MADTFSTALEFETTKANDQLNQLGQAASDMGKKVKAGVQDAQDSIDKLGKSADNTSGYIRRSSISAADQAKLAFLRAVEAAKEAQKQIDYEFKGTGARIKEDLARGLMTKEEAAKAGREAGKEYNAAILAELDKLGKAGANISNSKTYQNLAGSLIDPSKLKEVGNASTAAGLGIGRLRYGLISLIASATGTLPVLDRLIGMFLMMGVGSNLALGVLAALAAMAEAYKFARAPVEELKKAHEELAKSVEAWYKQQHDLSGATSFPALEALDEQIVKLTNDLNKLKAGTGGESIVESLRAFLSGYIMTGDFLTGNTSGYTKAYNDAIARRQKQLDDDRNASPQAIAEATRKETSADDESFFKHSDPLASLVKNQEATGAQRKELLFWMHQYEGMLKGLRQDIAEAKTAQDQAFATDRLAKYVEKIKEYRDALTDTRLKDTLESITDSVNKMNASTNRTNDPTGAAKASIASEIDSLNKQLTGLEKQFPKSIDQIEHVRGLVQTAGVNATNQVDVDQRKTDAEALEAARLAGERRISQLAAEQRAIGLTGAALAKVNADRQLELDIQAAKDERDKDKTHMPETRQAIYDQRIKDAQVVHDQTIAYAAMKEVQDNAIKRDLDEYDALQRLHEIRQQLVDTMRTSISDAVTGFSEHGVGSMKKFSDSFGKSINEMQRAFHNSFEAIKKQLQDTLDDPNATQGVIKALNFVLDHFQSLDEAMKMVGVGMQTYQTGYNIGMNNPGSRGKAAVEGTVAGAAQGAAAGSAFGPWGAAIGGVIGGINGLIGSLSGSKKAAEEAAKAFAMAKASIDSMLAGMAVGLRQGSPLQAQLAAQEAQYLQMKKQIDDSLAGKKNESERNADLARLNQLEAQRIQQIKDEAAASQKETTESLRARILRAQGNAYEADMLDLQVKQEQELQQARDAGWTDEQIAMLKQAQAAEKLRASMDSVTDSIMNQVAGYKLLLNQEIFTYQPAQSIPTPPSGGTPTSGTTTNTASGQTSNNGNGDTGNGGSNTTDNASSQDITVNLVLDGKTIATSTVKQLESISQRQYGTSARWSEVQV